jgi:tetratricopeptide (TPR) repeat protein
VIAGQKSPRIYPLWICAAFFALAPAAPLHAQATAALAAVEGTVRDALDHPLATATVYLQLKASGHTFSAHTDAAGVYRFRALAAGDYLLRATSASGEAAARPVILGDNETKKVDLTIENAFFDEPNFIVAGVSDPISRGGHGSDTVVRSTEELAKATAALTEGPSPGKVAEKPADALQTVREYQRAAELDPSEPNLFDWGTELLMHRAAEPATEVFAKGHRLYPHSLRMLLGLAAAWYAHGDYTQAAEHFFAACDLNPADPNPYMFLGNVQSIEITQLPGYAERLARFAKLHPDNAWANYYYAVGLWKQRRAPEDSKTPARVRELLQKAVRLDPHLAAGYLQLGIVYADQNNDAKAIVAYHRAIEADPRMDEPHYRLGQAYARTGQKEKARKELGVYQELSLKSAEEIERERSEIPQFVFELRDKR